MKTGEDIVDVGMYAEEATEHRHYLHAHPEPSLRNMPPSSTSSIACKAWV